MRKSESETNPIAELARQKLQTMYQRLRHDGLAVLVEKLPTELLADARRVAAEELARRSLHVITPLSRTRKS